MNNREYIESGILELYAAGALSSVERKEVEQMLAQHPELREELNAIEKAFEFYATAHSRKPADTLFNSILSDVHAIQQQESTSAKTIELPQPERSSGNIIRILAFAASILLFLSVAVNIYYYSKYQGAQDELAEMQDQNTMMASQYDALQADYEVALRDMDVIKNPAYIAVTMKGLPVSPNSVAVVYWDKTSGNVYISANSLPSPETGKQYQLWALVDGKPVDAGVFNMNGAMQQMKVITNADAFAVTLEPAGGVPAPTGDIYVLGNM